MTWEQGRAWAVSQYIHCAHDTAKLGMQARGARRRWAQVGAGRHGAGHWARGRGASAWADELGAREGAWADAQGRAGQGRASGATEARDRGAWGARHGCWARGLCVPGHAAGQQAVHSVHSAYF